MVTSPFILNQQGRHNVQVRSSFYCQKSHSFLISNAQHTCIQQITSLPAFHRLAWLDRAPSPCGLSLRCQIEGNPQPRPLLSAWQSHYGIRVGYYLCHGEGSDGKLQSAHRAEVQSLGQVFIWNSESYRQGYSKCQCSKYTTLILQLVTTYIKVRSSWEVETSELFCLKEMRWWAMGWKILNNRVHGWRLYLF